MQSRFKFNEQFSQLKHEASKGQTEEKNIEITFFSRPNYIHNSNIDDLSCRNLIEEKVAHFQLA